MKHIFTILLFSISANTYSQIVASSCELSGDIDTYIEDAKRLKLRQYLTDSTAYMDSVLIPIEEYYPVLENLMAVRNAYEIPEVDTINDLLVHTFPAPYMCNIILEIDTTFTWAKNLHNGNIITGNSIVDNIIAQYELYIEHVSDLPTGVHVSLFTTMLLNDCALTNLFVGVEGIIESYPNEVCCDGSDIFYTDSTDFVYITYNFGDGDCPSGCIINRYWNFKVYPDCSVQFAGATGSILDYLPVSDINTQTFEIFPNPVYNSFQLNLSSGITYPLTLQIVDMHAKLLFSQQIYSSQQFISVSNLLPGLYFAILSNADYYMQTPLNKF